MEERRLSEYRSILSEKNEEKERLVGTNRSLERRIVELLEKEERREREHGEEIRRYMWRVEE